VTNAIGTLNEGPLHQALKALYLDPGAEQEVSVGSYVADVRGGDGVLYEIQTGAFAPLKAKLAKLLESHPVVLVHPIAAVRYIVKLPLATDGQASRRRSPKRGDVSDVLDQLVSIPALLAHPGFAVEVILTEEDEIRAYDPARVRRRGGWRVVSRRLTGVRQRHRIEGTRDLLSLVPGPLPEVFSTTDLAAAMGQPRRRAQKLAYCLRETGVTALAGKSGNALLYRRL
jgi:hypothetical protein